MDQPPVNLSKPRFVYCEPGKPDGWPSAWDFPRPTPPGWPRVAPAHSCSPHLSLSPVGARVKALWFDPQSEGLDAFLGQICHIRLLDDAGVIQFSLDDKPPQYRDWLGQIRQLGDEQFGVEVLLKPERTPTSAEISVYGWDGTTITTKPWSV